jgi:hypothetical protein
MASDFSVAWQCPSKRTIGFSSRIKLHAHFEVVLISHFFQNLTSTNPTCPETVPRPTQRRTQAWTKPEMAPKPEVAMSPLAEIG